MKFTKSLRAAFDGLVYVVKSEQNARIHLLTAIIALAAGVLLGVSNAELAAIFFAIIIVFIAEIVNTAVEEILDLVEPAKNEQVKMVKDIAAAAVLVASIGAAAIGLAIYAPYVTELLWHR